MNTDDKTYPPISCHILPYPLLSSNILPYFSLFTDILAYPQICSTLKTTAMTTIVLIKHQLSLIHRAFEDICRVVIIKTSTTTTSLADSLVVHSNTTYAHASWNLEAQSIYLALQSAKSSEFQSISGVAYTVKPSRAKHGCNWSNPRIDETLESEPHRVRDAPISTEATPNISTHNPKYLPHPPISAIIIPCIPSHIHRYVHKKLGARLTSWTCSRSILCSKTG